MCMLKKSVMLALFLSYYNVISANLRHNEKPTQFVDNQRKSEQNCTSTSKEMHSTQEEKREETSAMQNALKNIGDQLDKFSSLYLGRLDQKFTSLASDVSSIDSNVKNIQERAHVWDTFQLHVSAWNEQIKSLDRKVDIINRGQDRIELLESKLSVLLNLEYTSQRTFNKVSSIEESLDKLDVVLTRIGSAETQLNQQFSSRRVLAALKQMERKFEKSMEVVQRNGNMRNRFVTERRITNGTVIRRNLIIKCPTPLVLEDLVKDMASKVDLIYDKLAVDNTSGEEEKKVETVDEIEDIDHDYSVEMYQNDNAEETKTIKDDSERPKSLKNRLSRSLKDIPKENPKKTKSRVARHGKKILYSDIYTKIEVMNLKIDELSKNFEGIEENDKFKNYVNSVKNVIAMNEIDGVTILNGSENILKLIEDKLTIIHNDLRCGFNYFVAKFKGKEEGLSNTFVSDCWSINATEKSASESGSSGFDKVINKTANKTDSDYEQDERNKFEEERHRIDVTEFEEKTKDSNNTSKPGIENTEDKYDETQKSDNILETEEYFEHCQIYQQANHHISFEEPITVQHFSCKAIEALSSGLDKLDVCGLPNSRHFCSKTGELIFQRRSSGSVDFARPWADYKWGFGDTAAGDYWLGTLLLSLVSSPSPLTSASVELRVELEDFDGEMVWAEYDQFEVAPESKAFALSITGYRGNATDSLSYHSGIGFSTRDRRHDLAPACCPCSNSYGGGGWWFNSCFESNLNGQYHNVSTRPELGSISWEHWRPEGSMRRTLMSLRITKLQESHRPTEEYP